MSEAHGEAGPTARLCGIDFSLLHAESIARLVTRPIDHDGVRLIVTCNLDHLQNLQDNREFQAAYDRAWLRTVDGRPLLILANLVHHLRLPHVTGADLFSRIIQDLEPGAHRPFFVASSQATVDGLIRLMIDHGFAASELAFAIPSVGFEKQVDASNQLASAIREHRATHLFMGVGSPKSEVWVHTHGDELGNLYAFGFGAGLNFAAGTQKRAPHWMRKAGLEWVYRIVVEPKRLLPRYARNAVSFVGVVRRDVCGNAYGSQRR